jgi:mannitol/fructose-specific phosphotransferase system IIA component (Ntr-type)
MYIDINLDEKSKVIEHLISHLASSNNEIDEKLVLEHVLKREAEVSTFIGFNCAIPHAHIPSLKHTYIVAGRTSDMDLVKIIFIMVGPPQHSSLHLRLLSSVARILHNEEIRLSLMNARNNEEFYSILCNKGDV